MKGEIIKRGNDWFVKFQDYTGWGLVEEVIREIPLHSDSINEIEVFESGLFDQEINFDLIVLSNKEGEINLCAKIIKN